MRLPAWVIILLIAGGVGAAYLLGRHDRRIDQDDQQWIDAVEAALGEQADSFAARTRDLMDRVVRADSAASAALALADTIAHQPPPAPLPPTAPASDSVIYWKARATRAEAEVVQVRAALQAKTVTAALLGEQVQADSVRIRHLEGLLTEGVDRVGCRIDLLVTSVGCPSRGVMFITGAVVGAIGVSQL